MKKKKIEKNSKKETRDVFDICIKMSLIGAALLIITLFFYNLLAVRENWIEVDAHITNTNFENTSRELKYESQPEYKINIFYTYEIQGRAYKGFDSKRTPNLFTMEQFKQKYTPGAELPVFYNPKNFAQSVLSIKINYSRLSIFLLIGGILTILGLLGMLFNRT